MSRLHSTLVAFVLGGAAATGLLAMARTVRLGQSAAAVQPALIARELASRQAKLERWSHSLELARAKHPPALPKIPRFAPVHIPPAPPAAPAAATPQVTYAQPPTVVRYRHAAAPHTTTSSSKSASSDDGGSDDGGSDGGGD